MDQLKALVWRSYKVRTRQYFTTALDLFGPFVVIILYVVAKVLLNQTHAPRVDDTLSNKEYFQSRTDQIDLKRDIKRLMCTKILYYSTQASEATASRQADLLKDECGLELTKVGSRGELVERLQTSLAYRVAFKASADTDLNKNNSTTASDSCIELSSKENTSTRIYQTGLVVQETDDKRAVIEIHMTDSAGSSVIQMPYSQGSTYNEYKLPQSDLNLGTHLIEICLASVFGRANMLQPDPPKPPEPSPNGTATTRGPLPPPSTTPSTRVLVGLGTMTEGSASGQFHWKAASNDVEHRMQQARGANESAPQNSIKWHLKPYPVLTGVYVLPISTSIVILVAFLTTNLATVLRVSEANEHGLHRYARLAGLPACHYWLSLLIVATIQHLIQALIVAILLGIPTGSYIYDPISDSVMTTRWMLLFTYSLAANSHAFFIASLFERSSTALLVFCLLGSMYAVYALLLLLQWTPYRFNPLPAIAWFALFNPASNLEALCAVLISVSMQTAEPFGWWHLSGRIIGGGFSESSVAELWALLLLQILVWMSLTILIDQFRYSTTTNFFGFIWALTNELCCCNYFDFSGGKPAITLRTGTKSSLATDVPSKRDPNRICCSLKHIEVFGPSTLLPYTKGNPLKLSKEQLRAIRRQIRDEDTSDANDGPLASKTTQFMVNTRHQQAGSSSAPKEQPLLLDDIIQQNIVWYKTQLKFEDLNLDFRFNQITFILGQMDLKELLFTALLGISPLHSGYITIDGANYTAATMSLARQHIGYLSDKDIFYNDLTIFENLQYFGSIREPSYKSHDSESNYVLSLLHLSTRRDALPSTLTHRSARKLALGVASVGYTKLLLLTEPTLNLRWKPRCQVHNLLKKYKSIRSIVVDSSDVDEAVAFGDRIVLLRNGSSDLSDSPSRLARRLACGYWLVFEPTQGDGRTVNSESIKALERLTNEVFKQDKLDLSASKVSLYQDLQSQQGTGGTTGQTQARKSTMSPNSPAAAAAFRSTMKSGQGAAPRVAVVNSPRGGGMHEYQQQHNHRRLMVIVKVHHSRDTPRALCGLMKMFAAKRSIHGFRLAQVSYESLEDILVLRMSRALYPDLPPDLLLSLQHRTQMSQKSPDPSPISVRKLSSSSNPSKPVMIEQQQQSSQQATRPNFSSTATYSSARASSGTIFAAGMKTIIRDRLRNGSELLLTLMALIVSLLVVLLTLRLLENTLEMDGQFDINNRNAGNTGDDRGKGSASDPSSSPSFPPSSLLQTSTSSSVSAAVAATALSSASSTDRKLSSFDSVNFYRNAATDRRIVELSSIEQLYKNRIGFYVLARRVARSETLNKDIGDDSSAPTSTSVRLQQPDQRQKQQQQQQPDANGRSASFAPSNTTDVAFEGSDLLQAWHGNKELTGVIYLEDLKNQTDARTVAGLVDKSRDLAGSIIVFDPLAGHATIMFEPHLPHVMLATVKTFLDFSHSLKSAGRFQRSSCHGVLPSARVMNDSSTGAGLERAAADGNVSGYASSVYTTRVNFRHKWHEMIQGFPTRRIIYGIGFAIAEAIAMSALVMAPIRHRRESRLARVPTGYWLGMAAFDLMISLINILGYVLLIMWIEGTKDPSLIGAMLIVLSLYKVASIPIPYLTSMAADSSLRASLFILLLYLTVCWDMAIFLRSFVEWTLYSNIYLYTISNWALFGLPITALIESLVVINQISNISKRCPDVPAYTGATNTVDLDGIRRTTIVDTLLDKVRECLASGKTAVSTDVINHKQGLGILWSIYLISLLGIIIWALLLTCERIFGIIARRSSSTKTSNDPMKTVIRLPDHTTSLFVWDKERDRLISEYIRCMNEFKYVNSMARNCLILRIWLKPMSDQTSPDHRVSAILEPLMSLGHSKNDIQIELRTTLQIFVRLGDETKHCRVDKIQLIETYEKYVVAHSDSVSKFAVVDWTRENMYKILLHGHYNNKTSSTTPVI